MIPSGARMLDVGCGDGMLAKLIMEARPDVEIKGIDVLKREHSHIPVSLFDGRVIPYPEADFDVVMFVDVLHHMPDPNILLRDARRVARQRILIKDHTKDGFLADSTLRLMDWVGNAPHGVHLPYNFWPQKRWLKVFGELKLEVDVWENDLHIYPLPASWLFDRSLHFVASLSKKTS
jgi:SAM-dependent methyltransferase